MTRDGPRAVTDDASVLRRSLVGLVLIAIVGLAAELLVERHWGTPVRLVPWFCLVALAYAALLLMRRPTAVAVRRARMLAGAVMVAAAVGVALHINENYVAGPLDQRYELLGGIRDRALVVRVQQGVDRPNLRAGGARARRACPDRRDTAPSRSPRVNLASIASP